MGWSKIAKGEGFYRGCAVLLLVLAACLVGTDRQTKLLFGFIRKTATYKAVLVLKILIWVDCIAAAYNLVQLIAGFSKTRSRRSYVALAWISFLLDEVAVYVVAGTTLASGEVGVLALGGEKGFQWMKVCNRYTRFCFQFGGALLLGFFAFLLLAFLSIISTFNLFRLYSPRHFFLFKPSSSSKPT